MQHHFKDNIPKVQTLIKKRLRDETSIDVEKEPDSIVPSYGVGKCVFLDRPCSSRYRVAMVAVTTKRTGAGLSADARNIFDALASINSLMADHRLSELFVPILGSGHGGLKPELCLVCMLISIAELHRRQPGKKLKEVNIVVYRQDTNAAPTIPEKRIKRALDFVSRLFDG